jgi:uncharacterized protein
MWQSPVISRIVNLKSALESKSHILLGPRQTGKSFLIRQQLSDVKIYDLLLKETFKKLSFNLGAIREELTERDKIVIIDEVQKLPDLLDEVQWLIENKGVRFLLTGSSARKLKRYETNLLGGRARLLKLHPFVSSELGSYFSLEKVVNRGLLPSVYFSDNPEADLESYIALYLQQEVANEGLTRNLPAFSRVLEVAALCQAEQTDFTAVSNDAQVPRTTVHEYFQILEDTLILHKLAPLAEVKSRKPVATSKYYFFDWGVARALQQVGSVKTKSPLFGKAFESFIFHELKSFTDYHHIQGLKYWRTHAGDEVDFILGNEIAIEVKGKDNVVPKDLKGLLKLKDEVKFKKYIFIYLGENRRMDSSKGIHILNYQNFLERLWAGEFF